MKLAKFRIFPLFLSVLLVQQKVPAQQCGNCKQTPLVASYDFDIQVAMPEHDDKDFQSWKQLFWLARHANGYLYSAK